MDTQDRAGSSMNDSGTGKDIDTPVTPVMFSERSMKIELISGHTALADDADAELLLPYSWYLRCNHVPGKQSVTTVSQPELKAA